MRKHPILEKKSSSKSSHKRHNAYSSNGARKGRSTFDRLSHLHLLENTNANIALGIIAVGLAGAATFLLLNPKKKTKSLAKNLYNTYNDFRDDAEEFAQDAYEKGRKAYELASDTAHDLMEHPYSKPLLLAGTIGGTLLGVSLFYLMNRNHKKQNTNFFGKAAHVMDSIKEAANSATETVKSSDWFDTLKEVLEVINEKAQEDGESDSPRSRSYGNSNNIQQAIELGLNGYRFWQNLKKKRRS